MDQLGQEGLERIYTASLYVQNNFNQQQNRNTSKTSMENVGGALWYFLCLMPRWLIICPCRRNSLVGLWISQHNKV